MSWQNLIDLRCDDCGAQYLSPRPVLIAGPEAVARVRSEAAQRGWSYGPDPNAVIDPEEGRNIDLCPDCTRRRLEAGGALIV